jgi:glucose/arabinose dehydrogenase
MFMNNPIFKFLITLKIKSVSRAILISLQLGLFLFGLSACVDESVLTKEVFECAKPKTGIKPTVCSVRSVEHKKSCLEHSSSTCLEVTKGAGKINYIPTPFNYVEGVFTEENYIVTSIRKVLNEPWAMDFLPSGEILVTQKRGKLLLLDGAQKKIIANFDVIFEGEVGLLGLAVDPDFKTTNHVFLFYTYEFDNKRISKKPKDPHHNQVNSKIVRFTLINNALINEFTIASKISGSLAHAGGRIAFGPDGKLYATTGDGSDKKATQSSSNLLGKILRFNKDGSVPEDNPFPGSYVYSLGHRNPQGIAWDPQTNELYESEHGPSKGDEINRILPGGNYGWGVDKCTLKRDKAENKIPSELISPIVCFKNWTMAPSGMEFVDDKSSPWYGNLFVAGLRGGHLRRYVLNNGDVTKEEIFFISAQHKRKVASLKTVVCELLPSVCINDLISLRLRDVKYKNGSLYVLGDYFGLVRIESVPR